MHQTTDASRRYLVTRLPNGLVRVDDRRSGLTTTWQRNGGLVTPCGMSYTDEHLQRVLVERAYDC